MKITNIYLHNFRNDEHFQFIQFVLALTRKVGAEALKVVPQKSHIEETSAVYNLLRELTGKHIADVELLDLGGWIAELDRLNKAVEKLLEGRADEGAGRTSLVLKEVRDEVDEAYAALAAMVEAQALVASLGTDTAVVAMYADFIGRLNERIELLNNALAQRRGHAAAKKKAEEAAAAPVEIVKEQYTKPLIQMQL
jgi:hypothetical protein